ncbi:MAG: SRPBCC family protein [Phototrophicaceae bacterium]
MPEISEAVTINRPVSEVFRLVAEAEHWDQWNPDIIESHYSDNRLRVGTMVTQSRKTRALGWRLDFNVDIVDYAPNRLIEYSGVLGRFPVRGRLAFDGSGGTTTVRETMTVRMGLYGLFSPFLAGTVRRRTRAALENLKANAEGGSR